jgi:hypothetical protein
MNRGTTIWIEVPAVVSMDALSPLELTMTLGPFHKPCIHCVKSRGRRGGNIDVEDTRWEVTGAEDRGEGLRHHLMRVQDDQDLGLRWEWVWLLAINRNRQLWFWLGKHPHLLLPKMHCCLSSLSIGGEDLCRGKLEEEAKFRRGIWATVRRATLCR